MSVDSEEDPEEEPVEEETMWRDIPMHSIPAARSPTPPPMPWSPVASYYSSEEPDTDDYKADATPPSSPESPPPPPPPPAVPAAYHDWMMGHFSAELTAADARIDELRRQLAEERGARRSRQDGMWPGTPRAIRREMTIIEVGARVRVRALPTTTGGLVVREDAEFIWAGAMSRMRDLTRTTEEE